MRKPNYDKFPVIELADSANACVAGWAAIAERLHDRASGKRKTTIAVDCYPGVDTAAIIRELTARIEIACVIDMAGAFKPEAEIDTLCAPFLGGDDPVFGFLCGLTLPDFLDVEACRAMAEKAAALPSGIVLVVGVGASSIATPDLLVFADLARWEIQQRQRRKEIPNLGTQRCDLPPNQLYKRAFFIDWRVADRWKKPLLGKADYFLDTHRAEAPLLADGEVVRRGLAHSVSRPFRVVPFFDPGVWGGQWMKEVCDLDRSAVNYAWCFDCVPEENSLLLGIGGQRFEMPSINLVFDQPQALLGEKVHARFGTEFPIRFDFLDTMGGGNLSFQVHPLTEYIQEKFGMHYTQDESYYMLDADPGAVVYLGLKPGVDRAAMMADLQAAQDGGIPFPDERYVNQWPARPHDHFLIPAGTVHCSGAGSMVLEISATPYIFTFKMWDWNRLGMDGKPRPIHLAHGAANIVWERDTDWTRDHLVNAIEEMASGDGWREERTGLHEREFIETRRHWFTNKVTHHSGGGVNVINLVAGDEAIVECPDGTFEPFIVHYAETFIVPAAVGAYTIRPHGPGVGQECATLKAFVRG